jgi:hypothetical protein
MAFLLNKKARSVITPGAAGKGPALRQTKGVGIAELNGIRCHEQDSRNAGLSARSLPFVAISIWYWRTSGTPSRFQAATEAEEISNARAMFAAVR